MKGKGGVKGIGVGILGILRAVMISMRRGSKVVREEVLLFRLTLDKPKKQNKTKTNNNNN